MVRAGMGRRIGRGRRAALDGVAQAVACASQTCQRVLIEIARCRAARGRRPSRDRCGCSRRCLSRARLPRAAHAPLVDCRVTPPTTRRRAVANPRATNRGRRLPLRRERRHVRERGGAARALPHRLVPVQPEAVGPRRAAAERGRVCGAGGGGRARRRAVGLGLGGRRRRRRGRRGRGRPSLARQPRLRPATPTAARSRVARRAVGGRRRAGGVALDALRSLAARRPPPVWAVVLCRGGHFAAAAYELQPPPKGSRKADDCVKVLAHRCSTAT